MGWLSDLFDPGKDDRNRAGALADEARLSNANFTGPGGIQSGFTVGPDGSMNMTGSLGDFNPVLAQLLQGAGGQLGGGGAGDLGFLQQIMQGSMGDLGTPNIEGVGNMQDFAGLGSIFQNAMPTAGADPFALGASVTDALRARAAPETGRAVNSAISRLHSKGRLGTTGGANAMGRLAEAENQQDLGFQLAGLDAGRGLQSDAISRMFGASQGRENIAGRTFGENATRTGMAGDFASQRFNMGGGMASLLLQNLLQGQNMGIQSLGAATGLAQLPLAFQSAAQSGQGLRSDAALGAATIHQGNAQLAKSPFLEAINAAGQFFQPIKFPGTEGVT